MKPNGKKFVARSVFFVVCAVASLISLGNAETASGTFKLSMEAHWGGVLLAPGDYEFKVDTESSGRIVTVRSISSGWSGMIMSYGFSSASTTNSNLELMKYEGGVYVRELYLRDLGLVLEFSTPRSGKSVALMKPAAKTTVSASGLP